jgi:hypothetical protein
LELIHLIDQVRIEEFKKQNAHKQEPAK